MPRPRIIITPSKLDKVLDKSSTVLLVAMWAFTVFAFVVMPETIPTHFNGNGVVDDYGNKLSILILPVIATLMYFGITALNQRPHIFNYATEITEENAERQYTLSTRMLRFVRLAMLLVFFEIVLSTYLISTGVAKSMGKWVLPVELAIMFVPTVVIIIQGLKKDGRKG